MKMVLEVNFIISIGLFLLVLVLGFILHKIGLPYNVVLFNLHKLISLGLVVFLSFIIYSFARQNELAIGQYFFISLVVLSVIALFTSGALLSMGRMNELMLNIHRIATGSFTIGFLFVLYSVFLVEN
jgi:hypothetical protein